MSIESAIDTLKSWIKESGHGKSLTLDGAVMLLRELQCPPTQEINCHTPQSLDERLDNLLFKEPQTSLAEKFDKCLMLPVCSPKGTVGDLVEIAESHYAPLLEQARKVALEEGQQLSASEKLDCYVRGKRAAREEIKLKLKTGYETWKDFFGPAE